MESELQALQFNTQIIQFYVGMDVLVSRDSAVGIATGYGLDD
jgi:hypothetical protein